MTKKPVNRKHIGLRVDGTLFKKFRYVCTYCRRSANAQITQLILDCIAEHEDRHGKIELPEQG